MAVYVCRSLRQNGFMVYSVPFITSEGIYYVNHQQLLLSDIENDNVDLHI